jgi:thioredoxin-like negative regulator of GroEL
MLQEVARRYGEKLRVRAVDVDIHRKTALAFAVHTVPTLVIQRRGRELHRLIGLQSTESLCRVIEKALRASSPAHRRPPGTATRRTAYEKP